MTVRLGVVGTGWWATFNHIPTAAAHPDAEVVAICDLDAQRVGDVGDKFGIDGRFSDLDAMLAAGGLDGVMVATPHTAHAEVAIKCLEAGLHVLVEKPMATSSADAEAMVHAARRAGKEILVPCGWNFRPYTAAAAALVTEGRIGDVRHIVCLMGSPLEDLFAGQPMLETADHMYRPPASTWADPEKAGGYGWGQMSHSLAWAFRVADVEPEAVFCMAGKSATGVDYYDAATVRLTNGGTMALSGASTVPKHCAFQLDIRIFGTEGMLVFDAERARLEVRRSDAEDEVIGIPEGDHVYDGTLPVQRFIEICAGNGAFNDADASNGARVVHTLDAMYRSMASGQTEAVRV